MAMSAAELFRQVAALPPKERALFLQLVQGMENGAPAPPPGTPPWPDFAQRLRSIYGEKLAPDSQSIIDEGRGDR